MYPPPLPQTLKGTQHTTHSDWHSQSSQRGNHLTVKTEKARDNSIALTTTRTIFALLERKWKGKDNRLVRVCEYASF